MKQQTSVKRPTSNLEQIHKSQKLVKKTTLNTQDSKVKLEYNMMSPNVNDSKDI